MGASTASQNLPPASFGPQVELCCLHLPHDTRHHCAYFATLTSSMGICCSLGNAALRNHDANLVLLRTATLPAGTSRCRRMGGGGLQGCFTSRLVAHLAGSAMQQKATC